MISVALKGLAGRKLRALLTALAVVIGVSMVSGTFILTDTMQKSFDGLFSASYDKTDAVVKGKEIVKGSLSGSATVPESLLAKVRALPEVSSAGGAVMPAEVNAADIIGRDGKTVARESIGASFDPASAQFSPLKLKTGAWAAGADQVVVDAGTAEKSGFNVGDKVKITTSDRTARYEITGTATFGDVDSRASAASRSGMSPPPRSCSIARVGSTRSRSPPRTARRLPSWSPR
jgi:putative ABC transport system permease protein